MSVKIRPYTKPGKRGFEVDIVLRLPSGLVIRERIKSSVSSRSGSKAWAQAREAELLLHGKKHKDEQVKVPTLAEFAPRFMESFVRANRQKPSTIVSKQAILDGKLLPLLGKRPLDQISDEDVQRIKAELHARKPKTVNNVLTVLSKLLKVAVRWRAIAVMPLQIELLKLDDPEVSFYEFEDYARLVESAEKVDRRALLTVLLGGDAGLRTGEIVGLEWSDIDFRRNFLTVSRSEWNGHVTLPKGGRARKVPMTHKLVATLSAHRHLQGPRVLYRNDGTSTSKQTLTTWMVAAQRRAGLKATGNKHMLRHSFCSHLAMRGATTLAIKELAGHRSLRTTMRYMHLSHDHKEQAIGLLGRARTQDHGDILETGRPDAPQRAARLSPLTPETQEAPGVTPELQTSGRERIS
jgi:integrase